MLLCDPARAAILGPGGIGKSTLAIAALHHPAVTEKYSRRIFVSCESANTCADLVSLVGSHVGLEPSEQLSKSIFQHFSAGEPSGNALGVSRVP
jgi:Fe-S cluster assembly ATPase SufC